MSDKLTLEHDEGRRFLVVELRGNWTQEDLSDFVEKAARLATRVRSITEDGDKRGRILLDLSELPVQPKDIAESLATLLPVFGERAGRVGVVRSNSTLQNLQVKRVLTSEVMRTFDSRDDAMTWLFDEDGRD